MERTLLAVLLATLGAAAILIGLSNYLCGPAATVAFFLHLIPVAEPDASTTHAFAARDVDSEFRFYAVFWIAFGALAIDAARNLDTRFHRVPGLLGLFAAAGAGRLVSWAALGPPNPFFVMLLVLELVTPLALGMLWLRARRFTQP